MRLTGARKGLKPLDKSLAESPTESPTESLAEGDVKLAEGDVKLAVGNVFSSIAPRPRGSSAEGCYFLRQEKVTKECFPQGRASRAFAAYFGELRLDKNRCFVFAEPRALQAPLASPHYHADCGKCSLPSRYECCLPNLIRETGYGWRLKSRTSCTRFPGARGTSPSQSPPQSPSQSPPQGRKIIYEHYSYT